MHLFLNFEKYPWYYGIVVVQFTCEYGVIAFKSGCQNLSLVCCSWAHKIWMGFDSWVKVVYLVFNSLKKTSNSSAVFCTFLDKMKVMLRKKICLKKKVTPTASTFLCYFKRDMLKDTKSSFLGWFIQSSEQLMQSDGIVCSKYRAARLLSSCCLSQGKKWDKSSCNPSSVPLLFLE